MVLAHRITHGLRSGADKPRLRGYEKRSRACALCAFFSARIFAPLERLRVPLSRRKNAANLSVMCHALTDIFEENYDE
jgi:hypothetical protein